MVFTPQSKAIFIDIFNEKKSKIKAFEGCFSVDLLQDEREENAMATWSIWESNEKLELYRNSEMFKATWEKVKPLFADKAKAWSYTKHGGDED